MLQCYKGSDAGDGFPIRRGERKIGDGIPFHVRSAKKLAINEAPIIIVSGKAHFDIGHAPKDQSNRRKNLPGYAAWEIHPVMKIEVQ
jgi:hypothetical protein